MSEEYDLKKSKTVVGSLYPVLLSKDGKVIDGFHRLAADPNWPTLTLEDVDSEEKLLAARPIANLLRRNISDREHRKWINDLARFYFRKGLKVGKPPEQNQIVQKIVDLLGYKYTYAITRYLDDQFKQESSKGDKASLPQVPASQRLESMARSQVAPSQAKELVERHREEVLEETAKDPEKVKAFINQARVEAAKPLQSAIQKTVVESEMPPEVIDALATITDPRMQEAAAKEIRWRGMNEKSALAFIERTKQGPLVLHAGRVDEAENVLNEYQRVLETVSLWGIGQHMILKEADRLNEGLSILKKIENKIVELEIIRVE